MAHESTFYNILDAVKVKTTFVVVNYWPLKAEGFFIMVTTNNGLSVSAEKKIWTDLITNP